MTYSVSWVRFGGGDGGSETFPDHDSAVAFARKKDEELRRGYFISVSNFASASKEDE